MKKISRGMAGLNLAASVALVVALQANAQESDNLGDDSSPKSSTARSFALEELVVTAQRREESLQDVPIAVSALTADRLSATGITSTQGLAAAFPGVSMVNIAGAITPRVRGIGTSITAAGLESPVAVYVDGVYRSFGADVNMSLLDTRQVSLVKGPQGTLFGRNATGGVMQIDTLGPEDEFSGKLRSGYDEHGTVNLDAFVTGGMTDTTRGSLSASYTTRSDGFGDNLSTGEENFGIDDAYSLRGKLDIDLSDRTQLNLVLDYAEREGTQAANLRPFPGTQTAFASPQPDDVWSNNSNKGNRDDFDGGGVAVTLTHEMDSVIFKSISAYRKADYGFEFTPVPTETPTLDIFIDEEAEQITQEFQLSSDDDGAFNWTTGLYYYYSKATEAQDVVYHPAFAQNLSDLSGGIIVFPFGRDYLSAEQEVNSIAAFAQGTYSITERDRLTIGARYTWQETDYTGEYTGYIPAGEIEIPVDLGSQIGVSEDTEEPTWRLAYDHDFSEEVMGYLSYNRGFKSGGYNVRNPTNAYYDAEELDAYELGLKSQLFDGQLQLNVAGFYYDYTNLQVPEFSAVITIRNGAAAEVYGAEFDFTALIGDRLALYGGATWLDATFETFLNAGTTTQLPDGRPDLGDPTYDASGNDIPYSPELTFVLGANYSIPTEFGEFVLNVSDSYNSGFYSEADNFLEQDDYHWVDASLSWTSPQERVSAQLYVRNILDEEVASQIATISGLAYIAEYSNPPRTAGVSIQYRF